MEVKFYKCPVCGNIVAVVKDCGGPLSCCGTDMVEIKACSTDAAVEKHVPEYTVSGNIVTVNVGSVAHPMAPEHFIEWVLVQTKSGNQRKLLKPGDAPTVDFALVDGDEVVSVYAYCNLHGLWKK